MISFQYAVLEISLFCDTALIPLNNTKQLKAWLEADTSILRLSVTMGLPFFWVVWFTFNLLPVVVFFAVTAKIWAIAAAAAAAAARSPLGANSRRGGQEFWGVMSPCVSMWRPRDIWCFYLDDEDNRVRTEQAMQCVRFHTAQHRLFSGCPTLSGVIRCLFLHALTHVLKLNPQSPSLRVDSLQTRSPDRWASLRMCFKLRVTVFLRFKLRKVCLNSFMHYRLALTHISKTSTHDQNPVQPFSVCL